jgi:hypothetical protein
MKWWSLEQRCCQAPGRRVEVSRTLRHRHLVEIQMGRGKETPLTLRLQMAAPLVLQLLCLDLMHLTSFSVNNLSFCQHSTCLLRWLS